MLDLPEDVLGEILSRVPWTSLSAVRSTCKKWNVLSKNQVFCKDAPVTKQYMGFMLMNYRVCSLRLDLNNNNDCDFINPSIKQISVLKKVVIEKLFHCKGLLLCVSSTKDRLRLMVWNPYLGQIWWIPVKDKLDSRYMYTLGYDNSKHGHKIVSFFNRYDFKNQCFLFEFKIYDFSSNSWRVLDVNPDSDLIFLHQAISLKENTYFLARDKLSNMIEIFLMGFDYTAERFGPRLPLPFHSYSHPADTLVLSCIRDEQLAVLYCHRAEIGTLETIELWVTTKIELNVVSWSMFFKVDETQLNGIPCRLQFGSFFVNEEEKVAVVFNIFDKELTESRSYQIAYIIGQNGYIKSVNIGEASNLGKPRILRSYYLPRLCSAYVPSLLQLRINQRGKRKQRDY